MQLREGLKTLKFYTIQLPLILIAIPLGFLLEFVITFPFFVFCGIDGLKKKSEKTRSGR